MIHGYARCSTNESKQDIDRQVRELKQAGAENIFLEYEHGDAVVKCQLSSLLEQAQAGDTIITLEVSRLARSTKQLCEINKRQYETQVGIEIRDKANNAIYKYHSSGHCTKRKNIIASFFVYKELPNSSLLPLLEKRLPSLVSV